MIDVDELLNATSVIISAAAELAEQGEFDSIDVETVNHACWMIYRSASDAENAAE